jgi:CRISPR-associated endonuclease Cas1
MERGSKNDLLLEDGDDLEWRDRCEYWRTYEPKRAGQKAKYRYRIPLVLCGHGVRIRVDHDTLLIRDGLTHYPQMPCEIRLFPGDANLPDRIIMLDGSGGISFDALDWMSDQRIALVKLDWRGGISSVGGAAQYAANPKLVELQRRAKGTRKRVDIARWLIGEKIIASTKTLQEMIPTSVNQENAIARLEKRSSEIRNRRKSLSISQLLGIEGDCAAAYFRAWHGVPLNWSGIKRKPIPSNWLEIVPRNMLWQRHAQNARHPINAMLNYGYGILKSQLRSEVVAAGLDPSVGFVHGNYSNRIPLISDLMEPLRPVVDSNILRFALSHMFTPGDFTINRTGGCRLNPQMAKQIVKQTAISARVSALVNEALVRLRGRIEPL